MLVNGLAGWLADGPSSPFDSGIDSGAMVSVAGSIEVANEVVASGAVVEVVEEASATVEVVEAGWSCSRLVAGASDSIVGSTAVVEVVEGALATVEVVEAAWSCSRLVAGESDSIVRAGVAELEPPPHAEAIANRARPAISLLMI